MIQKFGSRIVSFHVKDMVASGIRPDCGDGDQRTAGQGDINFAPLFASAKGKTKYYFAERDPVALGGTTNFNPFRNTAESAVAIKGDPAPSLKASPKLFSSVPKGTPAADNQAPIVVTNDGDAPLVIGNAGRRDRHRRRRRRRLRVVSENCRGKTLAPNASCTINVGFKPTRSNYTSVAHLVIDSNSDDAVERVLITGAQTPPKVLAFHGAVNATVTAGIDALKALGTANDFVVDETADASTFTAANLAGYRAVVFLDNKGDLLNAAQETALQGYVQGGGGFVGIGEAAEAETSNAFITGLIGARPDAASPTTASDQTVVFADRVHPATKSLPLQATRNDIYYQWNPRPTGTVHTVARYHAVGAAAGDGTTTGGTDWPISWCRDYQGGRSFYTGMGRTAASFGHGGSPEAPAGRDPVVRRPRPRRLQGHDPVQLLDPARGQRRQRRPDQQRRVARRLAGQQRLGDLHRPRRLPHQRRARQDDRPGLLADHHRLRQPQRRRRLRHGPHLGPEGGQRHRQQRRHAGRRAARLRRPRVRKRGQRQDRDGPARRRRRARLRHHRPRLPAYYPTFNPDNPVHAGLADGDQRRITKMQQPRVSRFTIDLRPRSSTWTPRS